MPAFKYFDPYAAPDHQSVAGLATVAGGNRENVIPEAVVCIFCGEPVERGTPDTGALAGDDLHMDCYRKRYPNGHIKTGKNNAH